MTDKINALYSLTRITPPVGGAGGVQTPGHIALADSAESDLWRSKLTQVLDKLQSGAIKPEDLDRDLFDLTLNDLHKGFSEGFPLPPLGGELKGGVDLPDYNFVEQVNKNLYRFAGAKSYQQLSDMSNMLMGEDGKVVDFKTFRDNIESYRAQALGIDEQYNENWLYTEYNNAVNSGLAAKRWKEFEETVDLFPNLEYRTAGDSQVRPAHQQLNGIIKPINDPFWDTYYPPNDWGCRCRCRPTDAAPTSAPLGGSGGGLRGAGGGSLPDIPELFDNNVGKTGLIYNESHPYFTSKGISKSKTFATVRKFMADDHYQAQLPKYKELQKKYQTVSAINEAGGSIHQEAGFAPRGTDLRIARELSKLGDQVVLLNQDKVQATALIQGIKANFTGAAAASDITKAVSAGLPVAGTFTVELAPALKRQAVISSLSGYLKDPRFKSVMLLRKLPSREGKGVGRCILTRKDLTLKNYDPLKAIGL